MQNKLVSTRFVSMADNVIPATIKKPAISVATGAKAAVVETYDPNAVVLHEATGGFNSVVEIATEYCLQLFTDQVDLPGAVTRITPADLQTFIDAQDEPFESPYINTLDIDTFQGLKYAIGVEFRPTEIDFHEPHKVCVKYRGEVWLMREVPDRHIPPLLFEKLRHLGVVEPPWWDMGVVEPPPHEWEDPLGGSGGDPLPFHLRHTFLSNPGVSTSQPTGSPLLSRPQFFAYALDIPAQLVDSRFLELKPTLEKQRQLTKLHLIGSLALSICCDYLFDANADLKRVDVYADISSPEWNMDIPEGDVLAFYNAFLREREGTFGQPVAQASRVHLTPTISLAGRNPVTVHVTELPEFEVRVFRVVTHSRRALAVAFDLMPGCKGIIEDVQHFIGDYDYGVISDEYLVERICKHKWRLGGFDRNITIERPIKITRDGNEEDAYLHGILRLDTLDFVTIDTDSNTRTDYIRIGGRATGIPQYIRLTDGTIIGPDQVDFGSPENAPWSIFTTLSVDPDWSTDPEIQEIQLRAHLDAYRHLARPFARFPDWMQLVYSRVEGVTKHIFILGNLPVVFV